LYGLCRENPLHTDVGVVTAKIWLIGRAYAAAIERRRNVLAIDNDDFYLDVVAPAIINSKIDLWLEDLSEYDLICPQSIPLILDTHLKVSQLFCDISGLQKRSLASKYLHFHFPNLFYIYDSRVLKSLSGLSSTLGRIGHLKYDSADNEYRKVFEKCDRLHKSIKAKHLMDLNTREIDNLLLHVFENT